jgi:hypothetical protein
MISSMFRKIVPSREEETTNATAEMLRRMVPLCAVCCQGMKNHRYVEIGSAFQKANMVEMFRTVKAREWSKVRAFCEFDPMKNAVLAFAIMGPHDGGLVLAIKSPFELYESDDLYIAEVLPAQEMSELTAQVSEIEWKWI